MANSNMSPSDVRSTVNAIDESCPTKNPKAVQKGMMLGGKSSAGNHVESGFRDFKGGKMKK